MSTLFAMLILKVFLFWLLAFFSMTEQTAGSGWAAFLIAIILAVPTDLESIGERYRKNLR